MKKVNTESIPQCMKDMDIWCAWKLEGERKIPVNPVTCGNARVDIPSTFKPYEATVKVMHRYAGIGIRLTDRLVAIDLDHCIEDGVLQSWAQEIVDRFKDTYMEISPSGTGLHIILFVSDPFVFDSEIYYIKKGDIEVYVSGFTNRFMTVTGNTINNANVSEYTEELEWVLETYMRRPTPPTPCGAITGNSYLNDDSVIAKASAAQNGEKFIRLWDGNIEGYPSHSEADVALCSILAFWCGGDTEQMDRLFRQSGLMRNKWDEYRGADTYGNMTISKALSGITAFYKPIAHSSAAEDFGMERLRELNPLNTDIYPWTDIGAGRIFAEYYEAVLRYVPERKSWFYYKDGIWNKDTGGLHAMKYCMELANLMYTYALEVRDEDKRKAYMKYVGRWQSHANRVNILKDAQVYHPISASEFDADPYVFNCKNGTIHVQERVCTEHCSTDKLTKISDVTYDPSAHSDRWDTFISEIMSGDMEKAKFLQKVFGYGLTGDTRHECMTILYGASTRNGKGTLCESVLKVLGSYGCTARPETIAQKNNISSSQPSEDIARLAGVRFVNISEPGKGLVLNAAQVKSMTGNDTINARFLHENSFDFQPLFKLYINTNYLPAVNDMTIFTSGRVIIIPFERHFDESEQDKSLKKEFAKPEVQSAILNWLLDGYALLQKEGLTLPQSVKEATTQYKHDSDKLVLFMEDCMEPGDYEERTSAVYGRYKAWCMENGHFAESMKNFKQSLETVANVTRKRPRGGGEKTTVVTGYRLLSDFLE